MIKAAGRPDPGYLIATGSARRSKSGPETCRSREARKRLVSKGCGTERLMASETTGGARLTLVS